MRRICSVFVEHLLKVWIYFAMYTRPAHFNYVDVFFFFNVWVSCGWVEINFHRQSSSSVPNDCRFSAFLLKQLMWILCYNCKSPAATACKRLKTTTKHMNGMSFKYNVIKIYYSFRRRRRCHSAFKTNKPSTSCSRAVS